MGHRRGGDVSTLHTVSPHLIEVASAPALLTLESEEDEERKVILLLGRFIDMAKQTKVVILLFEISAALLPLLFQSG